MQSLSIILALLAVKYFHYYVNINQNNITKHR